MKEQKRMRLIATVEETLYRELLSTSSHTQTISKSLTKNEEVVCQSFLHDPYNVITLCLGREFSSVNTLNGIFVTKRYITQLHILSQHKFHDPSV